MNEVKIRVGTLGDLGFVLHLQRKFSNALGFLPGVAIEEYLSAGRVLLAFENEAPAGYVLGRGSMRFDRSIKPVTQAAVCMDAQRRHLGLALIEEVAAAAFADGREMLQCWCAQDLDSMAFWPAAGFMAVGERKPQNARGRMLTLWRRGLVDVGNGRLLKMPPVAGWRARRV